MPVFSQTSGAVHPTVTLKLHRGVMTTPERMAVPGLLLLVAAAMFATLGTTLPIAAVALGLGTALVVCAVHEALVGLGSRR
jgi:hypothetical protein